MPLRLKVIFTIMVHLCDRESFKFFLSIGMKSIYVTKLKFETGQYIATRAKGSKKPSSFIENIVSMLSKKY